MSFLPKMNDHLLKVEGKVNRVTYQVRWSWSARNYYSDDNENFAPTSLASSNQRNSFLCIASYSPFTATVDWGDGLVEQFQSISSSSSPYNYVIFRSLIYEKFRASQDYYYRSGDYAYTIPPHKYADDDEDTLRTVTIECSEDIYLVRTGTLVLNAFPIVEAESLETLSLEDAKYVTEIPFDTFQHIPNLTSLTISTPNNSGTRISPIPESLWTMTQLTTLSVRACFDLWDIESSGIRNISKLQNLQTLSVHASHLPKYIKEFNDLPNLRLLGMGVGSLSSIGENVDDYPTFDEVDEINQHLQGLSPIEYGDSTQRTIWPDLSGKGLENLSSASSSYSIMNFGTTLSQLTTDMPEWFRECRSMSAMTWVSVFNTQARKDAAVESLYDLVTNWEYVTYTSTASDGKRNQFYGMTVSTYSSSYPSSYYRPSGTYQAPDGFEEKVSDGNPASPMEMIYVLEKNYGMTISVVSEAEALSAQNYLAAHPGALNAPEGGIDEMGGGNALSINKLAPLVAFYLFVTSFNNIKLREGLSR